LRPGRRRSTWFCAGCGKIKKDICEVRAIAFAVAVKNSQEAKRAPRHAPGKHKGTAASSSKRGVIDASY
jgi:hypothetical protein